MPLLSDLGFTLNRCDITLDFNYYAAATSGDTSNITTVDLTPTEIDSEADIVPESIGNSKISELSVGKLTTDTVYSQRITLDITDTEGDVWIASGKTDFGTAGDGFIMGKDDSDSNAAKFYLGNATDYLYWTAATGLVLSGSVTATSGAFGGWIITADTFYSLASGTPTSSPADGIVIDSSNPVISIYEDTAKRLELGYLASGIYGIKGYDGAGTGVLFELSDTQALIGGWTIGTTTLINGNVTLDAANEKLLFGAATTPVLGNGVFLGKDGADYEFRCGDPAGARLHWDATNLILNGAVVSAIASGSEVAIQNWNFSGTFSVTDADTVAWTSGTLTFLDGTSYSILAGNTGNMSAFNYIYLDTAVSITVLQVATSFTPGAGKVIIATAQNGTTEASYLMMGGSGDLYVDGANISAASVIASKMSVAQLSAITADLGTITAGTVTGATLQTAASGTRFVMTSTAFQGYDAAGNVIFEVIINGEDAGDVILGDNASNTYIKYDDSAGTIDFHAIAKGLGSTIGFNARYFYDAGVTDVTDATVRVSQNADGDIIIGYCLNDGAIDECECIRRVYYSNGVFYGLDTGALYGEQEDVISVAGAMEATDNWGICDHNGLRISCYYDSSAGNDKIQGRVFGTAMQAYTWSGTTAGGHITSDNTNLWICDDNAYTTVRRYTVSGTTVTYQDAITLDAAATDGFIYDGTYFWGRVAGVIKRYNATTGATLQTITLATVPSDLAKGLVVLDDIVYICSYTMVNGLGANAQRRPVTITFHPVGMSTG